MSYPVTYDQHPPEERNRLTVFFRYFCAIPHFVVGGVIGIGVFFALLIAWFALLFTGRYPQGLYDFVSGWVRFQTRVIAYATLVVDQYPPFGLGEEPDYPIQVRIAPPAASYSRVKVFFRGLLAIPVYVVAYVMQLWMMVMAVVLWFVGVFAGRTGANLTETMRMPLAYTARANAYYLLLTEDWPPFDPKVGLPAAPEPVGLPS